MDISRNRHAFGASATVEINGRLFVVQQPTPGEESVIQYELRRQCLANAKTPLQLIIADVEQMPPHLARMAIEAAVAQQSGSADGKAEPSLEQIASRLYTPEGLRFRFWYLARKNQPSLTLKELDTFITAENVNEVLGKLWLALGETTEVDDTEKKTDTDGTG